MPSLNPFADSDAFNMVSLTKAVNLLPNNYGRIRELNLFPGKGVRTRTIMVEEFNGVLNLLQTQPPGSPGLQHKTGKRTVRNFTIPHIPLDDVILPEAIQGVRAFGTENELQGVAQVVNDHLQQMRNKFSITLEHLRAGAIAGQILDADTSVLYDLFTEFGITQTEVDFDFGTPTTNVPEKVREVLRAVEDALMGEVMTGLHCLCSESFYDALVSHDTVKEAYLNWSAAAERIGGDLRKGFVFGGVTFEEYRAKAPDIDGNVRNFIADGDARFFPVGTMSTFETLYAPADFNETANTLGLELYAKQEARQFNRGIDIHLQSNFLPICYRPGVLVRGYSSS